MPDAGKTREIFKNIMHGAQKKKYQARSPDGAQKNTRHGAQKKKENTRHGAPHDM